MMNLEKIKSIIQDYDELDDLARERIKVLEGLDSKYSTRRGIEDISFDGDKVYVTCDDTCRGCYDSHSFDFPVEWLCKSDDELAHLIITEREIRKEKERLAAEEEMKRHKEAKDKKELQMYNLLKKKFENQ